MLCSCITIMRPNPLLPQTVSRLHCESESFKMELILDVNTQAYPVELGKSIRECSVCHFVESKSRTCVSMERLFICAHATLVYSSDEFRCCWFEIVCQSSCLGRKFIWNLSWPVKWTKYNVPHIAILSSFWLKGIRTIPISHWTSWNLLCFEFEILVRLIKLLSGYFSLLVFESSISVS